MPHAVETEIGDGILVVRQNRPEVLNARNEPAYIGMIVALGPAPSIGQHNERVMAQILAYGEDTITELVVAGALG